MSERTHTDGDGRRTRADAGSDGDGDDGESVVADFVGRFALSDGGGEPVRGRVVLSERRLVLAPGDGSDRVTVPLDDVFDVSVGEVPAELRAFFSDSVTVAFQRGRRRRTAVVEADGDVIRKFSTALFRAVVDGATVMVEHPARVGGRVRDTTPRRARIRLGRGGLRVLTETDARFTVELEAVSQFRRVQRSIRGSEYPAIQVKHMRGENAVVTYVALNSQRKLNVLGRYLRLEYDEVMADLQEVELSDDAVQALITLYSAGGETDLTEALALDPRRATMVLNSLAEAGLVVDGSSGTKLTPKGRVVVDSRLESVNR